MSNMFSGGSRVNWLPAAWVPKEVYEGWKAYKQCTRCGCGHHKMYLWIKYNKLSQPEKNSSNNRGYHGKQIQCKKSFDTEQQDKVVCLSRDLTRQERLDNTESGLDNLGNLFETLDEIQPHLIALKSRVILEGLSLMSSQFLCWTERPDSVHIIYEILVRNIHRNIQRVKERIDCGATSIFIWPSLLRKLQLPHEPAFTSTKGLNTQVMMSARERQKASLLVQYFEHRKLVDESQVSVVPT